MIRGSGPKTLELWNAKLKAPSWNSNGRDSVFVVTEVLEQIQTFLKTKGFRMESSGEQAVLAVIWDSKNLDSQIWELSSSGESPLRLQSSSKEPPGSPPLIGLLRQSAPLKEFLFAHLAALNEQIKLLSSNF